MKPKGFLAIILIFIVCVVSCSNNKNNQNEKIDEINSGSEIAISDIEEQEYAAREKWISQDIPDIRNLIDISLQGYQLTEECFKENISESNDAIIEIWYPIVTNLVDTKKQEKVNDIIYQQAMKYYQFYKGEDMVKCNIESDYIISFLSEDFISIVYFALIYPLNAAYPHSVVYSANINMKEGSLVYLQDALNIDSSLVDEFWDSKVISPIDSNNSLKDYFNYIPEEEIEKGFMDADKRVYNDDPIIYSYYTMENIGIIVRVSHRDGDYVRIEFPYSSLKNFFKNDVLLPLN